MTLLSGLVIACIVLVIGIPARNWLTHRSTRLERLVRENRRTFRTVWKHGVLVAK